MTTSKQVAGGSAAGDRHSSTPCGWSRPAVEEKAQCAVRSIAGGSEVEGPKKTREAVRLGFRRARTKVCEKSMAARRPGRKMMTGERKKSSSRVSCHRPRDTAFIRRKCKQVKAEHPRVRHQTIVITKMLRSQLISDEHARYKT